MDKLHVPPSIIRQCRREGKKSFSGLATTLANRAIYACGKPAEFETALQPNAI